VIQIILFYVAATYFGLKTSHYQNSCKTLQNYCIVKTV